MNGNYRRPNRRTFVPPTAEEEAGPSSPRTNTVWRTTRGTYISQIVNAGSTLFTAVNVPENTYWRHSRRTPVPLLLEEDAVNVPEDSYWNLANRMLASPVLPEEARTSNVSVLESTSWSDIAKALEETRMANVLESTSWGGVSPASNDAETSSVDVQESASYGGTSSVNFPDSSYCNLARSIYFPPLLKEEAVPSSSITPTQKMDELIPNNSYVIPARRTYASATSAKGAGTFSNVPKNSHPKPPRRTYIPPALNEETNINRRPIQKTNTPPSVSEATEASSNDNVPQNVHNYSRMRNEAPRLRRAREERKQTRSQPPRISCTDPSYEKDCFETRYAYDHFDFTRHVHKAPEVPPGPPYVNLDWEFTPWRQRFEDGIPDPSPRSQELEIMEDIEPHYLLQDQAGYQGTSPAPYPRHVEVPANRSFQPKVLVARTEIQFPNTLEGLPEAVSFTLVALEDLLCTASVG